MIPIWNPRVWNPSARRLTEALARKPSLSVGAMPATAEAYLVWTVRQALSRTIVWVCNGPATMEEMYRNMFALSPEPGAPSLLMYPPWDILPKQGVAPDPEVCGQRLDVLSRLSGQQAGPGRSARRAGVRGEESMPRPFVVATCGQALVQACVPRPVLAYNTLFVDVSGKHDLDALVRTIERLGYRFQPQVETRGEAAARGGIIDVWPLHEAEPLRIELAGTNVESIRTFNPNDQRSVEKRVSATILPASEFGMAGPDNRRNDSILSYLPPDAVFVWSDPEAIRLHVSLFEQTAVEEGVSDLTSPFETIRQETQRRTASRHVSVEPDDSPAENGISFGFEGLARAFSLPRPGMSPDGAERERRRLLSELQSGMKRGDTVLLFLDTTGSRDRFMEAFKADASRLPVTVGFLSEGFVNEEARLVVVSESDLYGRRKMLQQYYQLETRRGPRGAAGGARVGDAGEIEPGDLVVHVKHGIGRYLGLYEIVFDGKKQEMLAIEYDEKAKLYVPVSHAHLLSRYVGIGRHKVCLHKLGTARWSREKKAAETAIQDMAARLLQTQAERATTKGHAFASDTAWQHEFEAAFPYRETEDQERAIAEVKSDMENSRPMDRLICGDAGYGKTEVAMRAAFKAAMDGKQTAVLVPTTVLAQQHYYTFADRVAAFPLRVEVVSRFCAPARRREILQAARAGSVDILIGTHCLLEPGVRFHNLGLVIIDEEQRFGVLHKEMLKEVSRLVDVLTLTATPIPRTLYMSLTGAKDLSTVQSAPEERHAVRTIVVPDSDEIVREAIMREINRDGQIYYLHNRIMSIEGVRKRLERLVPEARVGVAHSKMPPSELAATTRDFVEGKTDVLLSTTIIASGTDIPNANTILIDRPDRFGMAELYQLRGRVGRSKRQGYAYLLLPPSGLMDRQARLRIEAIRRYSQLGSGFRIAMRDLELRGAGNLLGNEQSGHIAAVGFGLYCQLLKRTIAVLEGRSVPPVIDVEVKLDFIRLSPSDTDKDDTAAIPYDYIEDERQRIETYRKIAGASDAREIAGIRDEMADRFGPIPTALDLLLKMAALRVAAAGKGIVAVEAKGGVVMLMRDGRYARARRRLRSPTTRAPSQILDELTAIVINS